MHPRPFRRFGSLIWVSAALALAWGCSTTETSRTKDRGSRGSGTGHVSLNTPMGSTPGPAVPSGKSSADEVKSYERISGLYSKGQYEPAMTEMAIFEKKYKKGPHYPMVENIHGLCYLLTGRPVPAIFHFKRAIEANPSASAFNQYVRYNLAKAEFEANQLDDAQNSLSLIKIDSLDKDNRIKVHYLRSRILSKSGRAIEAAREMLVATRMLSETELREAYNTLVKPLEQELQQVNGVEPLEKLHNEFQDSLLADLLLYRLGAQEIAVGSTGIGESHLRALVEKYPQSNYVSPAKELLASAQTNMQVDAKAVGVLLPMKGKFAKFGLKNLQAIEMAMKVLDSSESDNHLTLVVEDSGEEPDTAVAALNRLVFKHHVGCVIGPLLSKGVDQVARRAQDVGVPLISLARHSGESGEYVIQAGLTLQMQAREIARFAVEHLKMKKFAMVFPNDKVGNESAQAFWDSVESFGGSIVGAESYNPGETDFRQPIDKLSGLYYTEARSRELEALAKDRETQNIKKRTRKTEQFFNLRPIVDYEAVFNPDEPRVAGQILPTFAYRDVDKVKFLGTSSWDSPELASRAQANAENAYFIDAFNPDSTSTRVRSFIDKFKATFGADPSAMDALAYDAAAVTEFALQQIGEIATRLDIRDRLRATH
ncbi:MAG: penicillin-binding protein activator, partial [Bdellovibrionota bacterium]